MIKKDIFEELDLEEKKIAIELLPKHEVIEYLKKNSKRMPEVKGHRLDMKSQQLLQRIPGILLRRVEQSDQMTIVFINKTLDVKLKEVYTSIDEKVGKSDFIQNVFNNKEEENYIQALELLMEKQDLSTIMVFLKLSGIELKPRQQKSIKENIDLICLKAEVRQEIYDELNNLLEEKYKQEIDLIEDKHRSILKVQKDNLEKAKQQIHKQEEIIHQGQKTIKELSLKYEQKNKEVDALNKTMQQLENKCEKKIQQLNEKLKDKEEQLKHISTKNTSLEKELSNRELRIIEMQKNLDAHYEDYSVQYLARWKSENQLMVEEKEKLELDISQLDQEYQGLNQSISELTTQEKNAVQRLNRYNEMIKDFVENIDEKIIQSALEETIISTKSRSQETNVQSQIKPYIKQAIKGDEVELCDDIEDLISNIGTNFSAIGVRDKDDNYVDYIVSILAAKRIPLIIGYGARNVVRAISSAYAGEMPEIIALPSGFNDIGTINSLYESTQAKVVAIEGVIGQLNEGTILPLLREYVEDKKSDKLLFITCEDIESIKLLPDYLLEYMALVQIENIRPKISPEYVYSNGIEALKAFKEGLTKIDEEYSKMKKLFKGVQFNIGYIMTRTIILAYIHCIRNMQSSLQCLILGEVNWIGEYYGVKDQVEENITSNKRDFSVELERAVVGV